MPTFGFSAYVKLLSLSERGKKSEIKSRLLPSDKAFDFHRSMRLHARRLLVQGDSYESIIESISQIKRAPERNSALEAIDRIVSWRERYAGNIFECPNIVFESPRGRFKVSFKPDFAFWKEGLVATHLWNTLRPPLDVRALYGALSLAKDEYKDNDTVSEIALLSLRNSTTYFSSDVGRDFSLIGRRMAAAIDDVFDEVANDIRKSGVADIRDQPTA